MVAFGGGKKVPHDRGRGLAFPEIVGQEELKRALLAVAANDGLDGLLVRGEKGTAKSTAVRALTDLLPTQTVVADCPFGCPPEVSTAPAVQCPECEERTDPPTAERPVPLVTLPLGATRERIVGTLSVADALDGEHEFDPGLLARANRGILYVDEVNLLDDHLVDVLLDAAAGGVNRVERDGVSVVHPAEFTLVGTMNPEEGDLRPQLRDRFALQASVTGCADLDRRVEIIDRALGRDDAESATDGVAVGEKEAKADDGDETERVDALRDRLLRARDRLADVRLPPEFKTEIAELCRDAGLDGHRGDIATARAARTIAALDGRSTVIEPDVRRGAQLALPHRLRSQPFEDAPDPDELIDDHFDDEETGDSSENEDGADEEPQPERGDSREPDGNDEGDGGGERDDGDGRNGDGEPEKDNGGADSRPEHPGNVAGPSGTGEGGAGSDGTSSDGAPGTDGPDRGDGANEGESLDEGDSGGERDENEQREGTPIVPGGSRAAIGESRRPDVAPPEDGEADGAADGRRVRSRANQAGVRRRTERATASSDAIDAAASVRAASARGAASVESRDLRHSVREGERGALVVFAVDASASMLPAMRAAKGTVLELLKDAYEQRDEVAFVAFAGEEAEVLLPPTDSVTLAARHLKELPTGDRTPLPAGLRTAGEVVERADPAAGVVVLVTDGRANVAEGSPIAETRAAATALAESNANVVVVDASDDGEDGGLIGTIADETDGRRIPLSALSPAAVDAAVDAASGDDERGI